MTDSPISPVVDELWERRADLSPADEDARKLVVEAVDLLDTGAARVAQVVDGDVVVDERAKRAILLSFKVLPMVEGANAGFYVHDRVPLKTTFDGVRVVAGAVARWGSFFEPGVVLMPSYTNIGGYVGAGSMVDTWATVGSCAQIGRDVHLSGGVGIGGVLEPPQAAPVVVEDEAFIGSRSMVVEGARVRRGAKLGAGAILTASTRVFDATTGEELPARRGPRARGLRRLDPRQELPGRRLRDAVPAGAAHPRARPGARQARAQRRAARARRRALMRLDLAGDPVDLCAALVDVPSVSGSEGPLADAVEQALRALPHLQVDRDGDAVVARTQLGRDRRVLLAGHLDTVPIADNVPSRREGELLHGCGTQRHEVRRRGDPAPGRDAARAGVRRDVRAVRQRGGRGRAQRAQAPRRAPPRLARRRPRHPHGGRPTARSRRAARAPCASR